MRKVLRNVWMRLGLSLLLVVISTSSRAQEQSGTPWDGEWIAEGTLFQIAVSVVNGVMIVRQIESMGQEWSNEDGTVDGKAARVPVEYAGATGIIQAELIDDTTAIVFAASCLPDFMVVCVLSKDRQAIFKKVVLHPTHD